MRLFGGWSWRHGVPTWRPERSFARLGNSVEDNIALPLRIRGWRLGQVESGRSVEPRRTGASPSRVSIAALGRRVRAEPETGGRAGVQDFAHSRARSAGASRPKLGEILQGGEYTNRDRGTGNQTRSNRNPQRSSEIR